MNVDSGSQASVSIYIPGLPGGQSPFGDVYTLSSQSCKELAIRPAVTRFHDDVIPTCHWTATLKCA